MGYDASLYSFDENEIVKFIEAKENGEDSLREYLGKYLPEEGIAETIEKLEDYGPSRGCIVSMEKIGNAKVFGIPYFRHYEFLYFWEYAKRHYANCKDDYEYISRYVTGSNAQSYRAALPKGMLVLEGLFRESPPDFFGISFEDDETLCGYASAEMLQKSGMDAIKLLREIRMSNDEPVLKTFMKMEAEEEISQDWLNAFAEVRDAIAKAIEDSVQKKYGLVLFAE